MSRGNSGAKLDLVVHKHGPGERERAQHMQRIGPEVCPEIIEFTNEGYIMPFMRPMPPHRKLLCDMQRLLESEVWFRAPTVSNASVWYVNLTTRLGANANELPDGWLSHRELSLTHGDPTISNALMHNQRQTLIIGDALPRKDFVRSSAESDMGRMIQSAIGWEVWRYGAEVVDFEPPPFWFNDNERRAALFWCAATVLEFMDKTPDGREWCLPAARSCVKAMEL